MTKTRKVIKYLDKPLFFVTALLFLFGLIMVFSSSNVTAYMSGKSAYGYFIKQGIFLGVSALVSFIIIKFNTKLYGISSTPLLILIVTGLVALLLYGKVTNQAKSWFQLGPITIQPSEFAKVVIIAFIARYYELNEKRLSSPLVSAIPLVIGGIIAFLIILQPDLGTAIIFSLIVIFMFLIVPIPRIVKSKIITFGVILVLFAALVLTMMGKTLLHERQLERLTFTNPCSRLLNEGNQVCNGYIAINNGGLTGVGLGNSTQKYLYLPEPYTDFIFAVFASNFGLLGCFLFLLLLLLFDGKLFFIAIKKIPLTDKFVLAGIIGMLIFQQIQNIGMTIGLLPITGITLPFISYGGSSLLSYMILIGIILNIREEHSNYQYSYKKKGLFG